MITWLWRSFNELTTQELYDILSLRQYVFLLEQHCFYQDLDYLDQKALHLIGYQNEKIVAYLRLFPKNSLYPNAVSFGRVLTASFARGQGVGKKLLQEVLRHLKKEKNTAPIIISAQLYLEKFYQSYGFQTIGEPFDEDGILHIKMEKPADEKN